MNAVTKIEQRNPIGTDGFEFIEGRTPNDNAVGLMCIDHLTHNVMRRQMDVWSGFYERIANFREIRYFHIEGKFTGLY